LIPIRRANPKARAPDRDCVCAGDDLIAERMQRLELDHQYVQDVAAFDQHRAGPTLGGAAARSQEWRAGNFAIDVDDGRTRLFVVTERLFERNEVLYSSFEEEER
jgi:hypothetical protein